MIVVEKMAKSL